MDFYTKEWKDFVYSYLLDFLPKKYCITNVEFVYDDKCFFGDYNNLINSEYAKFCYNRKKYIQLCDILKCKFDKYEVIDLPNNPEDEYREILKNIYAYADRLKNKTESIINELKNNNIDVDLDINDVDFILLSLNKVTLKTKKFYEKLRYYYNQNRFKNISDNCDRFMEINCIENTIWACLTGYSEYLNSRKDNFEFNLIDKFIFHDSHVLKYEHDGNDIIIDLKDDYSGDFILRLIFRNCSIIGNENLIIDNGDICVDVSNAQYGNYADYNYYMSFEFLIPHYCVDYNEDYVKEEYLSYDEENFEFISDKVDIVKISLDEYK